MPSVRPVTRRTIRGPGKPSGETLLYRVLICDTLSRWSRVPTYLSSAGCSPAMGPGATGRLRSVFAFRTRLCSEHWSERRARICIRWTAAKFTSLTSRSSRFTHCALLLPLDSVRLRRVCLRHGRQSRWRARSAPQVMSHLRSGPMPTGEFGGRQLSRCTPRRLRRLRFGRSWARSSRCSTVCGLAMPGFGKWLEIFSQGCCLSGPRHE